MSEYEWLEIFVDNLKDILEDANMTQRELADALDITETTISRYLTKQRIPRLKHIINMSYALDISIDELVDFGDRII